MTSRRSMLRAAGAAAATALAAVDACRAQARAWPERTVRIVVGFPPGQTTDLTARMLAEKMGPMLGQNVIVENRAGAAGTIAHEIVKNAPPDGYTLLITSSGPLAINPTLYKRLPYDPVRDFTPVVLVNASAMYLVARASLPVSSVREMVALVKANPGKFTYGSGGSGVTQHIAMEMLKDAAGLDLLHVPYKGSPAMVTDLLAGNVDFCFEPSTSILPHVRTGRVKALAISSAKRSDVTPDVPTVAEQGVPDFEARTWAGILAPAGTPAPVVEQLNKVLNAILASPEIGGRIRQNGSVPGGGTSAEFSDLIRSEIARWGKAVRASGAQVD